MSEALSENDELTGRVIGAAISVHRALGPGFLESIYEEAMALELTALSIPFARQVPVTVLYRDQPVGEHRLDLLVNAELVVELKAVDALAAIHTAQVLSYLKATGLHRGLVVNFRVSLLRQGLKRVVL